MKTLLFLFLICPAIALSQCAMEDILVFDHGISKFDVVKKAGAIKGFKASDSNANVLGKWEKPEYLTDSVFMDKHFFGVANLQCYKLNPCTYSVYFADDKLFRQNIQVEFDGSLVEDFNEINKKLIQLFKLEFAFAQPITINQPGTETKSGEGFIFTDTEGFQNKTDHVKVYNSITYKYDVAQGMPTGEIDKYVINIESVNLAGTKLDYRGY